MAKKETKKKPLFGNLRSHAMNTTKRSQKPNLQPYTKEDGSKVLLSAREIKALKKQEEK